eukprot:365090-Chlamydomonas_euryale.AAC.2
MSSSAATAAPTSSLTGVEARLLALLHPAALALFSLAAAAVAAAITAALAARVRTGVGPAPVQTTRHACGCAYSHFVAAAEVLPFRTAIGKHPDNQVQIHAKDGAHACTALAACHTCLPGQCPLGLQATSVHL